MLRRISTLVAFILIATYGNSQNTVSEPAKPFIEITGRAERLIAPDEIYISIRIRERETGRDKISIEEQDIDLKKALQELKIPLENLKISNSQADYTNIKWSKMDVISQNQYELKVNTGKQVIDVFKKLDEMKIHDANVDRVSHSRITEFNKEVRIMAITAAKEKADYLLEAIGESTGKPLEISEIEPAQNINTRHLLNSNQGLNTFYMDMDLDGANGIEFTSIKLESNIYAKFEIK